MEKGSLSPEAIIDAVSKVSGVESTEILSKSRKQDISLIRQIAIYCIRRHYGYANQNKVADLFGVDRSSISRAISNITFLANKDIFVRQTLDGIRREIDHQKACF